MHRIKAFAARNTLELLRDPLSYIFCAAFPLVMLLVMTLVDQSIPPQAGMTVFRIDNLCGGVMIFGQMFVMLFTAITVARDRSGAFLVRMYATPMTGPDFILGYTLPMLAIALGQGALIGLCAMVTGLFTGTHLSAAGLLLTLPVLLPSALLMTGLGLLFGTLLNEKAAPGMCSVIISLGSFLGSVWFDAQGTGGVLLTVCRLTPFYHCTAAVRAAIGLHVTAMDFWLPAGIVCLSAAAVLALACLVFRRRMRADLA